jgi:hypothetical protein
MVAHVPPVGGTEMIKFGASAVQRREPLADVGEPDAGLRTSA